MGTSFASSHVGNWMLCLPLVGLRDPAGFSFLLELVRFYAFERERGEEIRYGQPRWKRRVLGMGCVSSQEVEARGKLKH